jgi:hypothetical protein
MDRSTMSQAISGGVSAIPDAAERVADHPGQKHAGGKQRRTLLDQAV